MQKQMARSTNLELHSVHSTSMAWSDVISYARLFLLFFTDPLRNPSQMLVEPLGSVEPWLKITDLAPY